MVAVGKHYKRHKYLLRTLISFSSESSFPLSAFLSIILMANNWPGFSLLSPSRTSEKAPLKWEIISKRISKKIFFNKIKITKKKFVKSTEIGSGEKKHIQYLFHIFSKIDFVYRASLCFCNKVPSKKYRELKNCFKTAAFFSPARRLSSSHSMACVILCVATSFSRYDDFLWWIIDFTFFLSVSLLYSFSTAIKSVAIMGQWFSRKLNLQTPNRARERELF